LCPASIAAATDYPATAGYDLAVGLGSVNFNGLLTAWSGGSTGTKSFTLAATNVTIAAGGTGTSTVTITPQNGYTGTIAWTVSSSPSSADLCFAISNAAVSGTSATTASLAIKTSASACGTGAIVGTGGKQEFAVLRPGATSDATRPLVLLRGSQAGLTLVVILLVGFGGRRHRRLRLGGSALLLIAVGMVGAGCSSSASGGGTPPSSGNAAKGTYTLTVTGTDTTTASTSASTTLTLTIN
jgi:hypothetical protein